MRKLLHIRQLLLCQSVIILLLLAACAGPQKPISRTILDNSKPNMPSLYYYLSGSIQHYAGDYVSAADYYNLAWEQDKGSYQIRKQMLINSAFAYLNKQQDEQTTIAEFEKAEKEMVFDNDLLNIAYTVYSNANNLEGLQRIVSQGVTYYPSTLNYLRKFYLNYSKNKQTDVQLLKLAYQSADHHPEDLILTAKMYSLVNPQRSLAILQEAYQLDPKPETDKMISEFTIQNADLEKTLQKFQAYRYPEDKDLMLYFLQTANRNRSFDIVNALANSILSTNDTSLIGELAFSAYLSNKQDIMQKISSFLLAKESEPASYSQIAVFLFAESLFSEYLPEPSVYAVYFNSAGDLQDVVLYAMLKNSFQTKNKPDDPNSDFADKMVLAVQKLLPESVFADYLKIAAKAKTVEDQDFLQARANLCNYFLQKNLGELDDWTFLLQYYQQQNRQAEKIALLRKAINIYPDNPLFLNDLGYTLLDFSEHLNEAGSLIQRAVALEPTNAYYQDSLAWYYYLTSDFNGALEHINLPMQLKDMPTEISYHIGMILIANQKNEEAMKYLQTATEDKTNPLYQEKARQALEELQK